MKFLIGIDYLTAGKALDIAKGTLTIDFSEEARNNVRKSHKRVLNIVDKGAAVYGINTGFGPLCTSLISKEETSHLQVNILKSHSVGVGNYIDVEIAKLMLILKVHALAKGYSGVAESTIERIIWHIENDVIPVVPEQGSVGASGDLAPLSHLFLPLIGFGKLMYNDKIYDTAYLLKELDITPIDLGPKEGLALINGTQFIAAHAVKVVSELQSCLIQADVIAALMIEGLQGSLKPFFPQLHQIRPYKGTIHVASVIYQLLEGSEILNSHINCSRVQDPYSLRCIPQVHGASRNAWLHLKELLEIELNAVTDNPLIIDDELTISGGNFHGQPLAMALDYACLAASELGNISDRRIYLSLEGTVEGVPKLLLANTGLNSGFMILQYTSAALASENKTSCFPASADSIPTSLGQEDHVSMGSISGRKALRVINNLKKILAIELICAAQAIDFRRPLKSTPILENIHAHVRKYISFVTDDRIFYEDIEQAISIIENKEIVEILHASLKMNS
ncbi:MAG: histidine ammonia-lyase, partial [Bacteroidia bacterium]